MNPIDILGELLGGGKSSGRGRPSPGAQGGGIGTEILKDILGGGSPSKGFPTPSPTNRSSSGAGGTQINARELEDMLGVGKGSPSQPAPRTPSPSPTQNSPQYQPQAPARTPAPTGDIFGQNKTPGPSINKTPANDGLSDHDKAVFLIRAMIHAAKADGEIDSAEQQNILDRVGDTSPETIQFLRTEFAQTKPVRDFAWSVPFGLEEAVYVVSLSTIDLDSPKEVGYLKDLAHGLRIPPVRVNQIHESQQVAAIYN